jgi:uncharacterized protein
MSPLLIDRSTIPQEGSARRFSCTASALGVVETELTVVRAIAIDCQLYKVERDMVVQGSLRAVVRLACSRCTEAFELPLDIALDAVYLPIQEISSERAEDLDEGGADVYTYAEEMIDISEMVRDKLLLSIPLQPHCMIDCKGLCPACGVNRNLVSCQCAGETWGSPFERLKGLRFSEERRGAD